MKKKLIFFLLNCRFLFMTEREQTPTRISPRLSNILFPDEKKRVEETCHTKEKSSRKRERSEEKGEILAV